MTAATLTRPACPPWCAGVCQTCTCGDPTCRLWHAQHDVRVGGLNIDSNSGELNAAMVALERKDTADRPGPTYLSLDIEEHPLHLSPVQARELAAALIRLADQGEAR